jgi:hypothetical protein
MVCVVLCAVFRLSVVLFCVMCVVPYCSIIAIRVNPHLQLK